MKKLKIGLIGVGGVMHYGHLVGYNVMDDMEIVAICDIDDGKLASVGEELSIPENRRFKSYKDIIDCEDVEAVDIATWNSVHCEIAKYAAEKGKPFSIEKPVGMDRKETLELAEATKKSGVPAFVCLSWRYRPYTRYVKYLIDSGILGEVYHIYIRCIKDSGLWEGRKREWRFDRSRGGSGVLGDLGSHMVDMVHFWGYEFDELYANTGIFIKERPTEETGEIVAVDTDDWCNVNAKLTTGASCTIELSRLATTISNLISFELYGEKGKLIYTYLGDNSQTIEFVDAKTCEKQMFTPPAEFNAIQSQSFVNLVNGVEDEYTAKIEHGLQCQYVLDAMIISADENKPVKIADMKNNIDTIKF